MGGSLSQRGHLYSTGVQCRMETRGSYGIRGRSRNLSFYFHINYVGLNVCECVRTCTCVGLHVLNDPSLLCICCFFETRYLVAQAGLELVM